jgi:hypothetical protein
MTGTRRIVVAAAAALCLAAASAAAAAADTGATVVRDLTVITQQEEITDPCNGETFTSTTTFRFMERQTTTPSGIDTTFELQSAMLEGVGASGARYLGELIALYSATFSASTGNEVSTIRNPTFQIVRTGEDGTVDDFFEHVVLIDHFNSDTGEYTLHIEHVSAECR